MMEENKELRKQYSKIKSGTYVSDLKKNITDSKTGAMAGAILALGASLFIFKGKKMILSIILGGVGGGIIAHQISKRTNNNQP